jgi:hypothetical protein
VGLEPDASNAFFMVSPWIQEKPPEELNRWGKAKVGFAPYRPYRSKFWGWHRGVFSRSAAGA